MRRFVIKKEDETKERAAAAAVITFDACIVALFSLIGR
jgi:hypothetical protein